MKCTVILDNTREEEIIIYAHQKSETIQRIEQIATQDAACLNGFLRGEAVRLDLDDIYCFATQEGRLYAVCSDETYLLKTRLCNVEEILNNDFVKINQSSIANIKKIKKFDATISGTIKIVFKNGYTDYVSRRNIKRVKERLMKG